MPTQQQSSIPDELAKLRERLQQIEDDNSSMRRELIQWQERDRELQRREEKLDTAEDEMFRERDKLRARARRRERDQLEKAAHSTRVKAIKALAAMLPAAKAQAKKGKPALLRLILRSTR